MPSQTLVIRPGGIHNTRNHLSEVPEGSALAATNVVLRGGRWDRRPGFEYLSLTEPSVTAAARADQLATWDGNLVAHWDSDQMTIWDGSSWSTISGTSVAPEGASVPRFAAAGGSLYWTSSLGIRRWDLPTASPVAAGQFLPLNIQAAPTLSNSSSLNWFQAGAQVAYRYTIISRNEQGVELESAPSGRLVVSQTVVATVTCAAPNAGDTVTVNGVVLTAVAGAPGTNQWDQSGTNFQDATSLAAAINAASSLSGVVTATALLDVVSITSASQGVSSFTVTSSNGTRLAVTGGTQSARMRYLTGIRCALPDDLDENYHRVRLYRSPQTANLSTAPLDSMGLVYEVALTLTDLVNQYVDIQDIVPDNLRGQTLQAGSSGDGISAANYPPNFIARDIALWNDTLWAADITPLQTLDISLISTATGQLTSGDRISINGCVYIAGAAENVSTHTFKVTSTAASTSATQNIRSAVESLINCINRSTVGNGCYAYYLAAENDIDVGKFRLTSAHLEDPAFSVAASAAGGAWNPVLPTSLAITAGNMSLTGTTVTVTTPSPHGWSTGQVVHVAANSPDARFTVDNYTITVTGASTFTYTQAATTNGLNTNQYDVSAASVSSEAERQKNEVRFSKPGEHGAWPLHYSLRVGSAEYPVLRVIPTRDSLLVVKADGIFSIRGDSPENYSVYPVDLTVSCLAASTWVALAGAVWGLTTQGTVRATDAGVQVMSLPIEADLLSLLAEPSDRQNVISYGFSVANEAERQLLLWLPAATGTLGTQPSIAYVYDLVADGWTTWNRPATSGLVHPDSGYLYLGAGAAENILVERKTLTSFDFMDETLATPTIVGNAGASVELSSTAGITAGDVLHRTAMVGSGQYQRILSVDDATHVTVENSIAWTAGAARVCPSISVSVRPQAVVPNPGSRAQFRELVLRFEAPTWTELSVTFMSDFDSDPEEVTVASGPGLAGDARKAARIHCPRSKSRATQLDFIVQNSDALSDFGLEAWSVIYNGSGPRTGRQ